MKTNYYVALMLLGGAAVALAAEEIGSVKPLTPTSVAALEEQAKKRVGMKARITLEPDGSEELKGLEYILNSDRGKAPNYARALASMPGAPASFAHTFKTYLTEGALEPETKLAMALHISSLNSSPYTAAHVIRLLKSTDHGQVLLGAIKSGKVASLPEKERLAIAYADAMTKEIHGLPNAEFQKVRQYYTDAQIIEMTMTGCFFNYFTRVVEGLKLPVEDWVLSTPAASDRKWTAGPARVALLSNETIEAMNEVLAASKGPAPSNLGVGNIANSLRAIMQSPAIGQAWMAYGRKTRESELVSREIKLQVSFAVSMTNGCRYCTLHQVLGLRKLGVSPTKLMAMKKDDGALTDAERTAVVFARKLTSEPGGLTDADYGALRKEFGERGALEVLLQTCNFAWWNRFTDGLRLPSEDTAIEVYRETYGGDFAEKTLR